MTNDPLAGLYAAQGPQESSLRRYGMKIAGGIACSAFVAFVMHLPYIKTVILWFCQIVLLLFGKPAGVEKLEDKFAHAVEKGRQVAQAHPDGAKVLSPIKAVKEVVAVKKTVEDVKDKAQEGVQTIKQTGEKVADALGHVGEKAKETVGGIGASVSDLAKSRSEAREKAMRDQLIVRARTLKLHVDDSWSVTRLQAEVEQGEREWMAVHGPNAQCTEPKCRYPMRLKPSSTGNRRCPRCGNIFSARTALHLGAPMVRPRGGVFGR